jgi:hypothetical protein
MAQKEPRKATSHYKGKFPIKNKNIQGKKRSAAAFVHEYIA